MTKHMEHNAVQTLFENRNPVFIVGSPRSGTTLLYHMILSSGGFAYYRGETHILNLLPPFFGNLQNPKSRKRALDFWAESIFFKITGLDPEKWKKEVNDYCTSYPRLLNSFMNYLAIEQGVSRWAECTPAFLLHMDKIKKELPDAKFIHIIRDGRDVVLSMLKLDWCRKFPLLALDKLQVAALEWQWMINKGRKMGAKMDNSYSEVHFEQLIASPEEALESLGDFINHHLDYNKIKKIGIGSVSKPNTAFENNNVTPPVNRWEKMLTKEQLLKIEQLIGSDLRKAGYQSNLNNTSFTKGKTIRYLYSQFLNLRFLLKYNSPLGKLGQTPFEFSEKLKNEISWKQDA